MIEGEPKVRIPRELFRAERRNKLFTLMQVQMRASHPHLMAISSDAQAGSDKAETTIPLLRNAAQYRRL